jgi:hypothetical protein
MRNPQTMLTLPVGKKTTNLADCNIAGVKKITVGKNCNAVTPHAKGAWKKTGNNPSAKFVKDLSARCG